MLRRLHNLPYPAEARFLAGLLSPQSRLPGSPPPARLAAAAGAHRVVGYLLDAERSGQIRLPEGIRRQLRARQAVEALHAVLLRRELAVVEPVVHGACGVKPVLIKGPVVADRLYPDPTLRPFSDLDLVVPRDRLRAAARALEAEHGYRPEEEPWSGFGERQGHHVSMVREHAGHLLSVELHWRLSDDPAAEQLDHSRLVSDAGRLPLAEGGALAVPSAEDELVILALHLLHERQKRLVWINDVALAAERASEAEWLGAFAAARGLGLAWVLVRGLDYAASYLALRRERPPGTVRPPPWGPLRAEELLGGWPGVQLGRLALGGWGERDGYVRSAARARRAQLGHWWRARRASR